MNIAISSRALAIEYTESSAAVQPQDRAEHVVQARVQTISVAQVDSTDQNALAAGITGVVGPICLEPESMLLGRDGVAEAGLEQLGHVVVGDHPIVADRGGELVDGRRDEFITVPAPEITAALAFVIHRAAQDDDAFHLVRGQHRHPGGDPAALRGAEHESLRDSEGFEYLQVGDGAVPVGELLPGRACGAVPVGLDGQHIHGSDECGIRVLGAIQLHRRGERVDHDERRKRRVVRFAELVADRRAAQVRNGDGFGLAGHSSLLSFSDVGCVAIAALGVRTKVLRGQQIAAALGDQGAVVVTESACRLAGEQGEQNNGEHAGADQEVQAPVISGG